ncbi:MAG: hypothetical protein ACK5MA_08510 [Parachlamydiaceae bacterium]
MGQINSIPSDREIITPYPNDIPKIDQILKLMECFFINEQKVDEAFTIAKTVKAGTARDELRQDICNAYLRLKTDSGCCKAYQVVLYMGSAQESILLDKIIEACIKQKTEQTIALADAIYTEHANCLIYSLHRGDFQTAQAELRRVVE